jgi:hypothetical protein
VSPRLVVTAAHVIAASEAVDVVIDANPWKAVDAAPISLRSDFSRRAAGVRQSFNLTHELGHLLLDSLEGRPRAAVLRGVNNFGKSATAAWLALADRRVAQSRTLALLSGRNIVLGRRARASGQQLYANLQQKLRNLPGLDVSAQTPEQNSSTERLTRALIRRFTRIATNVTASAGQASRGSRIIGLWHQIARAVVCAAAEPPPASSPGHLVTAARRPARGPNSPWLSSLPATG